MARLGLVRIFLVVRLQCTLHFWSSVQCAPQPRDRTVSASHLLVGSPGDLDRLRNRTTKPSRQQWKEAIKSTTHISKVAMMVHGGPFLAAHSSRLRHFETPKE